jgi:hypothetical protein
VDMMIIALIKRKKCDKEKIFIFPGIEFHVKQIWI